MDELHPGYSPDNKYGANIQPLTVTHVKLM